MHVAMFPSVLFQTPCNVSQGGMSPVKFSKSMYCPVDFRALDPYKYRANIELRNNSKIKFKTRTTKLTKVANSPYHRRVWLWDRLNESTQKATTKVKFKQLKA